MTASDIQDLLIEAMIRKAGGTKRHWRLMIGAVRVYDPATHPHCNWSVAPSGDVAQIAMLEHLLDDFRMRHPLVRT